MAPSVDQLDQPACFGIGLNVIDLFSAHVSAEYHRSDALLRVLPRLRVSHRRREYSRDRAPEANFDLLAAGGGRMHRVHQYQRGAGVFSQRLTAECDAFAAGQI